MLCNESTQNILTKLILENLRKALREAILQKIPEFYEILINLVKMF